MNSLSRLVVWRDLASLVLLAVAALCSAAVAASPEPAPILRAVFGVLLLVPLSGYATTRALFPRVGLGVSERVALVIGCAFATAIIGGFFLNATPLGLTAGSWALSLAAMTVVAVLVAIAREAGAPRSVLRTSAVDSARRSLAVSPNLPLLAAAVMVALTAFMVARVGAATQSHPGFTQLWLLPAASDTVTVGVRNEEGSEQAYRLELLVDGLPQPGLVSIILADGEALERTGPIPQRGATVVLEARLFRALSSESAPYRRVWLTLGAVP